MATDADGDGAMTEDSAGTQKAEQQSQDGAAHEGQSHAQQEPRQEPQQAPEQGPSEPQGSREPEPSEPRDTREASPPLPPRHTAVTPGPRATRLQEAYAKVLKRTLGQLRWDNFAGCYPTVSRRGEGVLRQVQAQMVDKLADKCDKEFDNIMASRHVVPKLNDLESLISDAARRRAEAASDGAAPAEPTPPHLLPPSDILAAHLHPSLVAHQSQLNARLQTTQSQNALLFDEVQRQRADIAALLDHLESVVADVHGANDALSHVVRDIAAEAREGDAMVAAKR